MKKLFKGICAFLSIAFVAVSLLGCNSDKDIVKTKSFVSEQEYLDKAVSNKLNIRRLSAVDGSLTKETSMKDSEIAKLGILSSTSMYEYKTNSNRFYKMYEINYNIYETNEKADFAVNELIWGIEKDSYEGKFTDEGYLYSNYLSGVVTDISSNYNHHVCTVSKDDKIIYYDITRLDNKIMYLIVYDSSYKSKGLELYNSMIKQ